MESGGILYMGKINYYAGEAFLILMDASYYLFYVNLAKRLGQNESSLCSQSGLTRQLWAILSFFCTARASANKLQTVVRFLSSYSSQGKIETEKLIVLQIVD